MQIDRKIDRETRGSSSASVRRAGVRAQAPVPVFVPYADFFQFQAGAAVSHARPRNEVVDLDSRSVLPSGPWGLVVGFRRRGLVR